jgi:SAM-dependent methyltransferase
VWLRHLVMADINGLSTNPGVVAELGPGDSIGIGLAALLSGADRYYAFDIVNYADVKKNVAVFDDLVRLFRARADIPGADEFPQTEPYLTSYTFPAHILTEERLHAALDDERITRIRASVVDTESPRSVVQYKVPWYDSNIVEEASVDMVFSQAVLEHVDELPVTYERMRRWLKPTGFMSHSIDFKAHGSADEWNGHWAYSDFTWKLIKGKRPYLINRQPHSYHLDLLNEFGFNVVCDITNELPSKMSSDDLAPRFRHMQPEDLTTGSAFIQSAV